MSVSTPTVLPRSLHFPTLLPKPPQPHPTPLLKHGQRAGAFNSRRDLQREMDELSEEEEEIETLHVAIRERGFNFLVPIGRTYTQQEEKNEASAEVSEESDDPDESSSSAQSLMEEGDNESAEEDLDADMEDMDNEGNITTESAEIDPDDNYRESSGVAEEDEDE